MARCSKILVTTQASALPNRRAFSCWLIFLVMTACPAFAYRDVLSRRPSDEADRKAFYGAVGDRRTTRW
jgi:hypothetical protein